MALSKMIGRMLTILLLVFAGAAFAQKLEVKITKIDVKDQKTPSFAESIRGGSGAGNRWARVEIEFETRGREWVNELEVRWLVAINADNIQKPAAMPLTVTYTDVKEGRHCVCAFISPKFFERYMRSRRIDPTKMSVYAEIRAGGQALARDERRSSRMPDKWYGMLDKMQGFPEALLPKYKTPFAAMDFDYYEVEKLPK